jgi:hypothetical protein
MDLAAETSTCVVCPGYPWDRDPGHRLGQKPPSKGFTGAIGPIISLKKFNFPPTNFHRTQIGGRKKVPDPRPDFWPFWNISGTDSEIWINPRISTFWENFPILLKFDPDVPYGI